MWIHPVQFLDNHQPKRTTMPKYEMSKRQRQSTDNCYMNAAFKYTEEDGESGSCSVKQDFSKENLNKTAENENTKRNRGRYSNVVGFAETFRFATRKDKVLILLGTLAAFISGSTMPLVMIVFGTMTTSFINQGALTRSMDTWIPIWRQTCYNMTTTLSCDNITIDSVASDENPMQTMAFLCRELNYPDGCDTFNTTKPDEAEPFMDRMKYYSFAYIGVGCCNLIFGFLQVVFWQLSAYNQGHRIRKELFRSILKQDVSWFDTTEIGKLNTRISDDVTLFESGIGEKLGFFCQHTATFTTGIITGFIFSWKLALCLLAVCPLLLVTGVMMAKITMTMTRKELSAYAKAGSVAEEVLGAIRTVVAFGGEKKECQRYNDNLVEAWRLGLKRGLSIALCVGIMFFINYSVQGLAHWYGSHLVFDGQIDPGTILIVQLSLTIGTFALGNAFPNLENFATARGAAYELFSLIDKKPKIDSSSPEGRKDEDVTGNVEFVNVSFSYPSRRETKVLRNVNMKIEVGQTVALVGPSGSGKSTVVQLLQRFYDPDDGKILMDGTNIRDFNVKWYRQQIGVVNQEPILFATTIAENVRFGKEDVTDDELIKACKEANAHDFIKKLPNQYNTLVGERGAQLSGGQKQRIAIARALVRNPKILLLDEATSALDTHSEATVQQALDKVRVGRTILVIAHRLSTIRNANLIIGMKDGMVTEQGSHDELMSKRQLYYELVTNQCTEREDDALQLSEPIRNVFPRESGSLRGRRPSVESNASLKPIQMGRQKSTEDKNILPMVSLGRVIKLNRPELPILVFGCLCALTFGACQPSVSIIFSSVLKIYSETGDDRQEKINFLCSMYLVIACAAGIFMFLQAVCFSRAGDALTMRLRKLYFQALMRQDIAYFDDSKNGVGTLCARLATDATAVKGATGTPLSTFFRSLGSIGTGFIIGFIYSWQLSLLILAITPFILFGGYIQMKMKNRAMNESNKGLEQAGQTAVEAIENIRTVSTLTIEERFYKEYTEAITRQFRIRKRETYLQATVYSFSNCAIYFSFSVIFILGAYLIQQKQLQFHHMFRVFGATVLSALQVGQATSFAPDYGKAKIAASRIFALLDRKPAIDSSDSTGVKLNQLTGEVKFSNVRFNYPTRPEITVLNGLDLTVKPGQTVALVGSSGCGKSTIVQLLERFYDCLDGSVLIESINIRDMNVQWLRRQIGIVSQEPILFATSIRENIAYGDNSRQVEMAEIIEAARKANIHDFISSLPQGYDTNVGDKGTQMSGGQKQRIAIARALVRNPKILLLDEATSALDTESEKVVQAALDDAQQGRTSIVIAHRLSTIQNADCIVVIHQGRVVEIGTHSELLQQRGRYYMLNNISQK